MSSAVSLDLKKAFIGALLVLAVGPSLAYVLAVTASYMVGAGLINETWLFYVRPVVAIAIFYGSLAFISGFGRPIRSMIAILFFSCSILLVMFCGPRSVTSDRWICEGLRHRIRDKRVDESLHKYLRILLSARASAKTEDPSGGIKEETPASLKAAFPERTVRLVLFTENSTNLMLSIGGPYLRYGSYVGMTSADVPKPSGGEVLPVVLEVDSNLVVFAQ
jgi:hypothetical protein